jgi:hypothetical protein
MRLSGMSTMQAPDVMAWSLLTLDLKNRIIATAMFSHQERRSIERLAIEQAKREAELFKADVEPLLPVQPGQSSWMTTWTHPSEIVGEHCMNCLRGLSEADRVFLKIQRIDPA